MLLVNDLVMDFLTDDDEDNAAAALAAATLVASFIDMTSHIKIYFILNSFF
jgi:hypothetical protein